MVSLLVPRVHVRNIALVLRGIGCYLWYIFILDSIQQIFPNRKSTTTYIFLSSLVNFRIAKRLLNRQREKKYLASISSYTHSSKIIFISSSNYRLFMYISMRLSEITLVIDVERRFSCKPSSSYMFEWAIYRM